MTGKQVEEARDPAVDVHEREVRDLALRIGKILMRYIPEYNTQIAELDRYDLTEDTGFTPSHPMEARAAGVQVPTGRGYDITFYGSSFIADKKMIGT